MKSILVVDDDEAIVSAIRESLEFHGYKVNSAPNGMEALRQLQAAAPDLLLLDIDMPGIDGVEFCARLHDDPQWSLLPVMFITGHAELQNKIAAYTVGADDYITKPFDMHELLLRIKAVLRRIKTAKSNETTPPAEPDHFQIGELYLDVRQATVKTAKGLLNLTPTELKLLKYLMQHADQLFSSEQLLQQVWDYPAGTGDPALVRWHIKNLRCKIEVTADQPHYLHTVPHHGYVLRG